MARDDYATDDEEETPLEAIASGAVTALTMLVAFGLLFAGFEFFWVAFVVGFAGLLPMAVGLARYFEDDVPEDEPNADPSTEREDALEELRQRYARGEFTEAEFERRVERLLETESLADARQFVERSEGSRPETSLDDDRSIDRSEPDRPGSPPDDRDRDPEPELEREPN